MVKTNPLKLGIFVTLACALFIYALLRINDGIDFFGSSITTYVHFKDVKGLQVGNNIRFAGIGIGEVKAIAITNDTTIRVKMELDASAREFLRKDAVVDITTDGLVGNMLITMYPGKGKAAFIQAGDTLLSQPKVEITGMLAELSQTNEKIAAITDNLLEISEKMNSGQGMTSLLLNDQKLAMNLLESSSDLRASMQNFNQTTHSFQQLFASVARGEGNLGYLLQNDDLEVEVNRLSDNLDTLIRVRTDALFRELETTASSLNASSQSVELLMSELTEERGLLRTLAKDTTATNHLLSTLANLDHGTEKFTTNMEAIKHNWFFRGYFKRQAKLERRNEKNRNQE